MTEQINALAGPGGRALLRLDLAQQLTGGSQKFVVINQQGAMNVQRTDVNQLLQTLGFVEALKEQPSREKVGTSSSADSVVTGETKY